MSYLNDSVFVRILIQTISQHHIEEMLRAQYASVLLPK